MIFVMLLFFCTLHYSQTEVLPSPFKISIAIPSLSFTPYTENINLQFLWLIVEYVVSYTKEYTTQTPIPFQNNNMISSPNS